MKKNKGHTGVAPSSAGVPEKRRKRRGWRILGFVALILVVALAIGRAILPWAVHDYVNKELARNPLYSGQIGAVQIHLWRGAYTIHDIQLSKTTGNVPVPLFSGKQVDLAIQWKALLHGKVVGKVLFQGPQINFVDAPSSDESQTGEGGAWLQVIQDLFPFAINSAVVENGSVHFRTYQKEKPVDVYLSQLHATIDNLRNINDETTPLNATVQASGLAMDEAKFDFKMVLDPFSYRPTFHMALRMLGLDVTKLNDLALTYGKFDFKRGWFDLVLDTDCTEGQITGYVKPLFRDLKVFSLKQDIKEDNVLQFFWQALIGAATGGLKNVPRSQFGTLVPFTGDASGTTSVQLLATIGNIFRNAFIRAYLPRLEGDQDIGGLHFEAPDFKTGMTVNGETQ